LSPVQQSSGVEHLETDTFKLHCLQTQTGRIHRLCCLADCDFTDTNSDDRKLLLCVIIGAGSGMAGMASHTNLKFSMAATYQSAEIWAVDFQENH